MSLFLALCLKILPLYIIILLGYLSGRVLKVDRQSIALLLFYFIVPVVFFNVALNIKIRSHFFLLPVICFVVSVMLCFTHLYLANKFWQNGKANIIAFSAGSGNTGYFGFPIALILFNEHEVGIYMLLNIGISIYDYTVGAYVMARGNLSKSEALRKVSQLPIIYAFILGLIFNHFGFKPLPEFIHFTQHFRGAYIILGMMVIGLGLVNLEKFKLDYKFISFLLSSKFLSSPLLSLLLIKLDQAILHIFHENSIVYKIMILLSIVPPAANTVIYATLNNCHPEEAAAAVLVGTILAMLYVPAMITLLM